MSVVGLDFGNDSSKVAVAKNKGIEVLQNDVGSRKTPNSVAFGEKQRYLAEEAVAQAQSNPVNTIAMVKRYLGRTFTDSELKLEQQYNAVKVVNQNGKAAFEVEYDNKQIVLTPEQIAASMFNRLKRIAEKGLGSRVADVVIGCPVWWTDAQRRAMLDAANIAGLNVLRLINETTAVALYYAMSRTERKEERRVMFIDVGHAGTQISVVKFEAEQLTVLASGGDRNLGGRNFDDLLIQHFGEYIQSKYKMDVLSNGKARGKLAKECTKVKHMLSANIKVPFNVEYIMNDRDVTGAIERPEFEALANKDLLPRLVSAVKAVLDKAGLKPADLTSVEIVGGGVRVPCIAKALEDFFGRPMGKTCDGDESVARGAAWMCAMLSPTVKLATVFEVKDINIYPITIQWGPLDAGKTTADTPPMTMPAGSVVSPSTATTAGGVATGATPDADSEQLFSSAQHFPHLKIISFTDRKEPFQLSAYYSDPSQLPTGVSPLLGKFIVSGMGALEKAHKIKVRVKLNIHSCLQVTGAEMVEVLPVEAAAPAAAAATTPPVAGAAPTATEAAKDEDEAPMDEKDDKPKAPASPPPPADGAAPAKAADGATPAAAAAPAPAKQKVKKTDLKVASFIASGFDQKTLTAAYESESKMEDADQVVRDTSLAKNNLEAYVLDMGNKLKGELKEYFKEKEANDFNETLMSTEEWLYDAGAEAQKSEYKSRRDALAAIGDAAAARRNEQLNRESYITPFKSSINKLTQLANTTDAKYEHILPADRQKVIADCEAANAWLFERLQAQDRLSKADAVAVTCDQIRARQVTLETSSNVIMNKAKPAPPAPEPKKEEAKKEEAKAAPAAEPKKEAEAPKAEEPKK